MRGIFFLLGIFPLFLFSYPAILSAQEPLAAPLTPEPESGAPFISFPLVLDWEDVPEAQSYRYELTGYDAWLQERTQQERDAWIQEWTAKGIKDWMEDGAQNGFLVTQSQSNPPFDSSILKFLEPWHPSSWYQNPNHCDKNGDGECTDEEIRTFIKEKQKHLWHVKSCEDAEGTICGSWGEVWDFTYLLGPAVLKTPAVDSPSPSIPITLDWDDVLGANSYDLITHPCPPWGVQDFAIDCYSLPILPQQETLLSEYEDDVCLFTRNSQYWWGVASCLDTQASFCTHPDDFPFQSFYTSASAPPLSAPNGPTLLEPLRGDTPPVDPAKPETIPSVSKSDTLRWNGDMCAYFYRINIFNEVGTRITKDNCLFSGSACTIEIGDETLSIGDIEILWDQPEDLNKTYSWSVTPCWGSMAPAPDSPPNYDCTNTTDSIGWYFHTAGKPPTLLTPAHNSSTKIPAVLTWERVEGAASYRYELSRDGLVQGDGSFQNKLAIADTPVLSAQATLEYAAGVIEPNTQYWWHVKTCVDEEGNVCGPWSDVFQFATFPLNAPATPSNPLDKGTTSLPGSLSWVPDPGANYYTYQVQYASLGAGETLEGCDTKAGGWLIPPKKVGKTPVAPQPSFYFSEQCLGEYRWQVASCLDKECLVQEPANLDTAPRWTFTAVEQAASGQGLVPCGRTANDPHTPYNEREACQLKHVGFLLQNLLDFILWKVSLFILLILAVITGATSYFSLGGPNALARIKTVFRSFFAGFLILMFAWMFVNTVLVLFGFQFEFFGTWWELSF